MDATPEELLDDLLYGARAGDVEELNAALVAGAPVDGRDANGTTALMMAAANGQLEAMDVLLSTGAEVNATNARGNTPLHWAVFTAQEEAIKLLLATGRCELLLKNEHGRTAAMDAERAGKGEVMALILNSLNDEDAAADALGIAEEEDEEEGQVKRVAQPAGVNKTLDATRRWSFLEAAAVRARDLSAMQQEAHRPELMTRERPADFPEIATRVAECERRGDWRYSVVEGVVPRGEMLQLSQDFFSTTELLSKEGNTFGPEFEQQYSGHKNYFYYMNRNRVVPGAEAAAPIFEQLDRYTRQVVERHHPGVAVRLERAFGAYYEGQRDGFHLGVNEHCDGDANLVSTVVHAVLPDGDVGFTHGGELTISEVDGLPAQPITHSNATVGSVVYLGGSIFHHASPIKMGGRRLVFCMFYAADAGADLSQHALA